LPDFMTLLRLLAIGLSISTIAYSWMMVWLARRKRLQIVIGFVLMLFPVWTLLYVVAEWIYLQTMSSDTSYGEL